MCVGGCEGESGGNERRSDIKKQESERKSEMRRKGNDGNFSRENIPEEKDVEE